MVFFGRRGGAPKVNAGALRRWHSRTQARSLRRRRTGLVRSVCAPLCALCFLSCAFAFGSAVYVSQFRRNLSLAARFVLLIQWTPTEPVGHKQTRRHSSETQTDTTFFANKQTNSIRPTGLFQCFKYSITANHQYTSINLSTRPTNCTTHSHTHKTQLSLARTLFTSQLIPYKYQREILYYHNYKQHIHIARPSIDLAPNHQHHHNHPKQAKCRRQVQPKGVWIPMFSN